MFVGFFIFFLILKGGGVCVLNCCRPVVPDAFTSASASQFVERPGIYQRCSVSRLKFRTLQTFIISPPVLPVSCLLSLVPALQQWVFYDPTSGLVTGLIGRPDPCVSGHWSASAHCGVRVLSVHWR